MIKFAGGLEKRSSKYFLLNRNGKSDSEGYIVEYDNSYDFKIFEGDSVHVPLLPETKKFVKINGQIKNPGIYPFNENMSLRKLVNATMSLESFEFAQTMNLEEVRIFRKNPNGPTPEKLVVDYKNDIKLKNGDHITIPQKNIYKPIQDIIITGEIAYPGIYPVNELTTLNDIIDLSGGLTNFALKDGIEIFRDSLKIAWEKNTFALTSGDSINVLKKSGLILMAGEVNVPGYISYKRNDSIMDYIETAGGFTSFADEGSIYITYPNGISKPVKRLFSPKVKEGSVIHINQRTISGKQELTGFQIFSMLSTQAGNIATTLITLSLLANQATKETKPLSLERK